MKKYTILVSGDSGIVGYGVLKSLQNSGFTLIGTTIYDESPANCFADIIEKAPMTCESEYLQWLIALIDKYNIDMLIPAIEADMYKWNDFKEKIDKTGAKIVLNNSDLINICEDKWCFYEKLKKEKFKYCIETSIIANTSQFKLPFILKPRKGYGSKGVVKIEKRENFENYKSIIGKTLLMQEYVGSDDEEYTVSAFFDKESNIKAQIIMKRKLSKEGYTQIAEVVFLEDILEIIDDLSSIFKPIGPTNFQFRRHNGSWKLLEINPRISSSTSIKTAFGYNEARMCIDYFLNGKEIKQPKIRTGKAIRYIEDYILYDSNII